jgi:hypothetical protein
MRGAGAPKRDPLPPNPGYAIDALARSGRARWIAPGLLGLESSEMRRVHHAVRVALKRRARAWAISGARSLRRKDAACETAGGRHRRRALSASGPTAADGRVTV